MEALVSIKEEEKINNKISKINLTLVLRVRRFEDAAIITPKSSKSSKSLIPDGT